MGQRRVISTASSVQQTGDPIQAILSGRFQLPETKRLFASPIQCVMIEASLDGGEADVLRVLGLPSSPAIVCDPNTYDALARRVANALPNAKVAVLEAPKADDATVDALIDLTRHADALIAVGSGTLNDLAKYAAHRRDQPYAVFATAPSMNGYVTTTASITRDGEKLSLPARPPKAAYFDLGVLAAAPRRLIQAGVGDSLCRTTAACDWWLSHQLFDTTFSETPFAIQAKDEARLISNISKLDKGDLEAVEALTRLLILGGLGMLIAGSSQPGSQGEHLISHYIDMMQHPHPGSLHGEQVGLATRTMAALQHHVVCRDDPPHLAEIKIDTTEMASRLGRWSASCEKALQAKGVFGKRLDALNQRLDGNWPTIQAGFKARSLSFSKLNDTLDTACVPATPEDLGLTSDFYREAVRHARELRDRFTMLDLAAHAGMLDPFIDQHS